MGHCDEFWEADSFRKDKSNFLDDETYENTFGIVTPLNERKEEFDFVVGLCIVLKIIKILKQTIAFDLFFQYIFFCEKNIGWLLYLLLI